MKKFLYILPALLMLLFASCDPGDMEIKKLNRKDGVWSIASMHYEYFDSTGTTVISDSTQSAVGEFVFFKSPTADALWDGYLVVANMNDANGTISAHPGNIFFDGKRVYMQEDPDVNHNFPDRFEGLWTVTEDHRKTQVWSSFGIWGNGNMSSRITITLKAK